MTRPLRRRLAALLPPALFILAVLFACYTAVCYTQHFADSDHASELLMGRLLAAQNRLVTTDWFYSTEIRVLSANLVYMPLFKIFSDFTVVSVAASLLFQAILLLIFYYLTRQLAVSRNAFFVSAALLLLPVSVLYGRMLLYQNYYTFYGVYAFLILGLFASVLRRRGQSRGRQRLRTALLMALALASSLNGFRQLPFTVLPLLFTALYLAARERMGHGQRQTPLSPDARTAVFLASGICICSLAGLCIHMKLLPHYSNYQLVENLSLRLPTREQLRPIAEGYLSLFGYQEGRKFLSMGGAANIGGLVAAGTSLLLSLFIFFRRETSLPRNAALLLYPVSMTLTLAAFLFTTGADNYPQYFLMSFVWLFPLLALRLDGFSFALHRPFFQRALVAITVLCLLLGGVFCNHYFIQPEGKQVIYDGHAFMRPDFLARQAGAVRYIEENGYEIGYATFWQANSVTQATNGHVAVLSVTLGNRPGSFAYQNWLTDKTLRTRAAVEGKKSFLLLTAEEAAAYGENPPLAQAEEAYRDAYHVLYALTPSTALWELLAAADESMP